MRFIAIAITSLLMAATAALATGEKPFDDIAFKADQAAGKPIVVHVTAPWCSTCKAQHQAIDKITANPKFASIAVYSVDFDNQPDAVKSFAASSQSTLIGFTGTKETGRIVGDAAPESVEGVFASTLAN